MEKSKNSIEQWLERLQQESWNLELLVSGFSIFLLIQAQAPLKDFTHYLLEVIGDGFFSGMSISFVYTLRLTSIILIINLIAHVFLRGFWIGAIGLRSVQKDIDYDKLNYTEKFTNILKKKIGSLDNLLVKLDTISSIIFSFSFLMVFMLLSAFLWLMAVGLVVYILGQLMSYFSSDIPGIIMLSFIFIAILTGIIYFIDTLSLGFFKKRKWLAKFYYPIYIFYGYICMAGIYRSIYYNMISRFSKRRIRLFLGPYLLMFVFSPLFTINLNIFFPDNNTNFELQANYYTDIRPEKTYISKASIPSQFIQKDFLPIFIRYEIFNNKYIKKLCTDYEPSKSGGIVSGFNFGNNGSFTIGDPEQKEENPEKLLNCLSQFYNLYINDSLYKAPDYYFQEHPNNGELGLQTVLSISHLPIGKNIIKINKNIINSRDSLVVRTVCTFPFWKE